MTIEKGPGSGGESLEFEGMTEQQIANELYRRDSLEYQRRSGEIRQIQDNTERDLAYKELAKWWAEKERVRIANLPENRAKAAVEQKRHEEDNRLREEGLQRAREAGAAFGQILGALAGRRAREEAPPPRRDLPRGTQEIILPEKPRQRTSEEIVAELEKGRLPEPPEDLSMAPEEMSTGSLRDHLARVMREMAKIGGRAGGGKRWEELEARRKALAIENGKRLKEEKQEEDK